MDVQLFRTDDPVIQAFVAKGILRLSEETYAHLEFGLAGTLVVGGSRDGQRKTICYVLYNPQRAAHVEKVFYEPMAQATGDPHQAAAFLAGHEVGHCLDHQDREPLLNENMVWTDEQAAKVGVQKDAFHRLFGVQAATAAYRARVNDLYGDLAQRQYEERAADAFGVLWVWRLGGGEQVLTELATVRKRESGAADHATGPVLDLLDGLKGPLAQTQSVAGVWQLARQAQAQAGIDSSLGAGSTTYHNPLADVLREAREKSRQSTPISIPTSKPWDAIPRFGAQPLP